MASEDTLVIFTPQMNEPPVADFATRDARNNHPVLDFDDTTDEEAVFSGVLPRNYAGGGITLTIGWAATDATVTPQDCVWQAAIERLNDDGQDMDTNSFAAFQTSGAVQEASVSGELSYNTITFTEGAQMDSVVAGELFRIKIRRDADSTSGTDNLTDDAEIRFAEIKET